MCSRLAGRDRHEPTWRTVLRGVLAEAAVDVRLQQVADRRAADPLGDDDPATVAPALGER
jgi:hypothetical protein